MNIIDITRPQGESPLGAPSGARVAVHGRVLDAVGNFVGADKVCDTPLLSRLRESNRLAASGANAGSSRHREKPADGSQHRRGAHSARCPGDQGRAGGSSVVTEKPSTEGQGPKDLFRGVTEKVTDRHNYLPSAA